MNPTHERSGAQILVNNNLINVKQHQTCKRQNSNNLRMLTFMIMDYTLQNAHCLLKFSMSIYCLF